MGKLADKLRGKSKLDNVIIAEGNYEQSAKDIAELESMLSDMNGAYDQWCDERLKAPEGE